MGAGLAGASAARTLLDAGWNVQVWESEMHVGGACADILDGGVYVQLCGPHHFRTEAPEAWHFVQRFAEWVPSSILFGVELQPDVPALPLPINERSEQVAGRLTDAEIEEKIFAPYTEKMWGIAWEAMPAEVRNRVKMRNVGFDMRYIDKPIQAVPMRSWSQMVASMLDGAEVFLKSPWGLEDWDGSSPVVFTGEPDALLGYREGHLKWRGAKFEHGVKLARSLCEFASVNTPHPSEPTLRKYENSRFIGVNADKCASLQFPADRPHYYPSGDRSDWCAVSAKVPAGITLAGRLGLYRYLDMDAAILDGIRAAREIMA